MAGEVWVDIPNSWCDPDSPEMTSLFFALRDNMKAFAEGDPSAPSISASLFSVGGSGIDGSGDAATFLDALSALRPGHYDFSSLHWTSGSKTLPDVTIIRSQGAVTLDTGLTITVTPRVITPSRAELLEAILGKDGVIGSTYYGGGASLGDGALGSAGGGSPDGTPGSGLLESPLTINRFWARKRPLVGGNCNASRGGGSLIIIADGAISIGAAINAAGQTSAGGGSIILISATAIHYLSGASFSVKGGDVAGTPGDGPGGGGYFAAVAPVIDGSRTIDMSGGASTYGISGAGLAEELSGASTPAWTAGLIKQMLWGR
jgi:hypothetical protein